jgi:PAS domain S-box-containing protein
MTESDNATNVTAKLKADRDRYVALAFCWADILFELNDKLNISFASGAIKPFTGLSQEEVVGKHISEMVVPEDVPSTVRFMHMIHQRGRAENESLRLRRVGGALPLPVSAAGYELNEKYFVALRMRAADAAVATDRFKRDEKTGMLNHEAFAEIASQRVKLLEEVGEKAEVSVIAVEGLEALKDRLGVAGADSFMSRMTSFIRGNSLGGDTATMVGDDKFSLVHQTTVDISLIEDQIRLMATAADPSGAGINVQHASLNMEGSAGLNQEDMAKGLLYAMNHFQKTSGSDFSIATLSTNITSLVSQGIQEINGFKKMVAMGRFHVALQPIIHAKTGTIHHYEALCRFDVNSPDESPYKYITFAEETGLIHEFDLAMAKKVVQWLSKMPVNNAKYNVAVNISGFSIGVPEYVENLHKLLNENPWTKGKLLFEITESSRMSDLDAANKFIQSLRKKGYEVCLDDFGAGAASFQYLSALEVDVVKIDGSAVKNAQKAPKGRAFLSALTELCNRLGVETIAEMIDTPETLDFVRDCRCNYVQGFLFGKPSRDIAQFNPLPQIGLFKKN